MISNLMFGPVGQIMRMTEALFSKGRNDREEPKPSSILTQLEEKGVLAGQGSARAAAATSAMTLAQMAIAQQAILEAQQAQKDNDTVTITLDRDTFNQLVGYNNMQDMAFRRPIYYPPMMQNQQAAFEFLQSDMAKLLAGTGQGDVLCDLFKFIYTGGKSQDSFPGTCNVDRGFSYPPAMPAVGNDREFMPLPYPGDMIQSKPLPVDIGSESYLPRNVFPGDPTGGAASIVRNANISSNMMFETLMKDLLQGLSQQVTPGLTGNLFKLW